MSIPLFDVILEYDDILYSTIQEQFNKLFILSRFYICNILDNKLLYFEDNKKDINNCQIKINELLLQEKQYPLTLRPTGWYENILSIRQSITEALKSSEKLLLNLENLQLNEYYKVKDFIFELIRCNEANKIILFINHTEHLKQIIQHIDWYFLLAAAYIRGMSNVVARIKSLVDEYSIHIEEHDVIVRFGWVETDYDIVRQEEIYTSPFRENTGIGYNYDRIKQRYKDIIIHLT